MGFMKDALGMTEKAFQEYRKRVIDRTKKEETIEWLDAGVTIPEKEVREFDTEHGKGFGLYSFMVSDGKGNITLDAHFGIGEFAWDQFDEPTWYICYDEYDYGEYSKTVAEPIEGVRYWRPMEFTGPIDTDEEDQMFGF